MAMNDSSSDQSAPVVTKKAYEKPSFRYEKVFVTTALSCGKLTHETSCKHQTKVS